MRISIRKVLFACLLLGGTAYGITFLRGPHAPSEKRLQIEQLEKENQALHSQIENKQNFLKRMEQNPDELSLEIKRRLGLVDKGGKSFMLQEGKPDSDPSAAPESGKQR